MLLRTLLYLSCVAAVACGDNRQGTPTSPDAPVTPDAPPTQVIPLDEAQAGGAPSALVIVEGRAFIGVGPRLAIWDLATGTLLGQSAPLRGFVQAVAVVGTRAYVAERTDLDSKLHILDITNPAAPVETAVVDFATAELASVIRDLEPGANNRLYVSDQEQGISELDLTNPDAPVRLRFAQGVGAEHLQLVGTRLYHYGSGFGIGVSVGALDVATFESIGQSALPGVTDGLAISGNLAVGAGTEGIYVYDLTNLATPIQRYHHGMPDAGPFARDLAVSATRAWIPADDGLHTLDLSNPLAITRTRIDLDTAGVNVAAAAGGTFAFTTDRGQLQTFDVAGAAPANPRRFDVSVCSDCVGVAGVGETVYLVDIAAGLRTAKLTDLTRLGKSPAIPPAEGPSGLSLVFEDVDVVGGRAYVADWLFGLRIYDVTDPAAVTALGVLDTPGAPSGVAVSGTRAFLAEGTGGGALRAIDVTDPAQPTQQAAVETSKAMAVKVRGNLAFVANEELFAPGGLEIYDVSDPAALTLRARYNDQCTYARDVALVGTSLAVVACETGWHVVDVTDPAMPTRRALIPPPEITAAWSVASDGTRAILGHDNGIIVVDLANPASPTEVTTRPTGYAVRGLAVPHPGRIVAACGLAGVYQWQLD